MRFSTRMMFLWMVWLSIYLGGMGTGSRLSINLIWTTDLCVLSASIATAVFAAGASRHFWCGFAITGWMYFLWALFAQHYRESVLISAAIADLIYPSWVTTCKVAVANIDGSKRQFLAQICDGFAVLLVASIGGKGTQRLIQAIAGDEPR